MLIASGVLRNDFDETKVALLAQVTKAKSLGWLDGLMPRRRMAG